MACRSLSPAPASAIRCASPAAPTPLGATLSSPTRKSFPPRSISSPAASTTYAKDSPPANSKPTSTPPMSFTSSCAHSNAWCLLELRATPLYSLLRWKWSHSIPRMTRVRGIGGIFFKSENPEALRAWYASHLGIVSEGDTGNRFRWNQPDSPSKDNFTAWCIFPFTTAYFGETKANSMVNYVVDDLHATLMALRDEGVWVDPKVEEYDYGKFGWIIDPDGSRIELWEPLPKK